jgi:hypothetical protein
MEVLGQKELILVLEAIEFRMSDYNLSPHEEEILKSANMKLLTNYKQLMEMLSKHK